MANWWDTDKPAAPAKPAAPVQVQDWWAPDKTMQAEYDAKPWYAKAGIAADDIMRIGAEGMTRGGLDKVLGPEEQAKTQAAHERAGLAGDVAQIGGALVASPYRVGSTIGGAAWGGLEGAASAYGHQKGWIPDEQGWWDIGEGAVTGSGLGAAGAKIGDLAGWGWSKLTGGHVPNPQAGAPNVIGKFGKAVEPWSIFGTKPYRTLPTIAASEYLLSKLNVPPGAVTGAATSLNLLSKMPLGQQSATMANPTVVAPWRDTFAKAMANKALVDPTRSAFASIMGQ
jgi:hypothetical protein